MPAHIRAALTNVSLSIPILGGRLALGTWQGVYLFEHRRRPHHREIALHLDRRMIECEFRSSYRATTRHRPISRNGILGGSCRFCARATPGAPRSEPAAAVIARAAKQIGRRSAARRRTKVLA